MRQGSSTHSNNTKVYIMTQNIFINIIFYTYHKALFSTAKSIYMNFQQRHDVVFFKVEYLSDVRYLQLMHVARAGRVR